MVRDLFYRLPPLARALLPGLVISGLALWGFVAILDEVIERETLEAVDQPLMDWLAAHREPWLTATLTFITNLFGPVVLPILVAAASGLWGWRTHDWRAPLILTAAMVFSTVVATVVKVLVERPRPADELQVIPGLETSFSFPSGHTTGASTLVLVTAYLLWRHERGNRRLLWWLLLSVVIVGAVGISRMYLGYHFLTDVGAGACLGAFTLGLVVCLSRWLDLRARRRAVGLADQPRPALNESGQVGGEGP